MKKINSLNVFKGVINNLRESVSSNSNSASASWFTSLLHTQPSEGVPCDRLEADILESLHPPHFSLEKTLLHGFPFKPTAMAFDPVQKILAIGNRVGSVRLLARPGIDITFQHESRSAVIDLIWLVNKGHLLSMCSDDCIYLWDVKQREVELMQHIRFNRERLTTMYLAVNSNWLFAGTERGNTHVLKLDTFTLSGYIINWNKAIGVKASTHPGSVTHLRENPADPSKLLIGFESGTLCLWDLTQKKQEEHYKCPKKFTSISWHWEGKQFVCSCSDGSLVTWNIRSPGNKPASIVYPHREKGAETSEPLSPIDKVDWVVSRDGDNVFIFSGGLPQDITGAQPSITVLQGKHTTVLEMEFCVVDFVLVTDSPYKSDYTDPESILVLLTNDLVAIDCKSTGLPSYENPYAMDFQESAVTCCEYIVDCPGEIIMALYSVGSRGKKSAGWSSREWPVSGGVDSGKQATSHHEILVTGHADGTVRFWDTTSTNMQHLYRLRTQKLFEKNKAGGVDVLDEDPYAVTSIALGGDCKQLAVAGQTDQVVLFRFRKKDSLSEIPCLEIPIIYEVSLDKNENSPHFEFPPRPPLGVASQHSSYTDPGEGFNFEKRTIEYFTPLKVRTGQIKKPAGFQPDLVCLTPWVNTEAPSQISCLTVNSNFGLMAYGNGSGLVIVDYIQQKCLLNMGTADLYGSNDPFQRMPKSPKQLPNSPKLEDMIVKVDLGNYNQVTQQKEEDDKKEGEEVSTPVKEGANLTVVAPVRVKSPAPKSLSNKAGTGSSAEESSLSKSRSSSVSSLDQVVEGEGVTAVFFGESLPSRNEFELSKCLYVGTSLGSVLVIVIVVPETGEKRESENVIVSPSGSLLRLRSAVLEFTILDSSLHLDERPEPLENIKATIRNKQNCPTGSQEAVSPPTPQGDQLVLAIATEKGASCFALPSQRQIATHLIPEPATVTRASAVSWLGEKKCSPVLLFFTSEGKVKGLSLPTFRTLIDAPLVIHTSARIARTLRFSTGGTGTYFTNPNQVQKFSVNKEDTKNVYESFGKFFQEAVEMPEAPKQSFFKGFFGGGAKQLDRNELFGESKASSSLAVVTQGDAMKGLTGSSISGESEIAKAKQAVCERGNKLNEVEEKTERLATDAQIWADTSHKMMEKYKNKKWYQL